MDSFQQILFELKQYWADRGCIIQEPKTGHYRTQDNYRLVIVSGIVLLQYPSTDHMAEAHAMVSLVALTTGA